MKIIRTISWMMMITAFISCQRDRNRTPPPELFYPPVHYSIGKGPTCVASADFNNDGNLDLITCNTASRNLSVLTGIGDGSFNYQILTRVKTHPTRLVTGEFTGDSFTDIAIMHGVSTLLTIMKGKGDGTFEETQLIDLDKTPTSIIASHFTEDEHLDLAISFRLDEVRIFRGLGQGLFMRVHNFDPGDSPSGMTATDFNNDGKQDLIIANNGIMMGGIAFFQGKGNGTFSKSSFIRPTLVPLRVDTADFSEDGRNDLVVVFGERNTLGLLIGQPGGAYAEPIPFGAEGGPVALTIGDYNQDGHLDLAVPNNLTHNLSIVLGKGDGTFVHPPINYYTGKVPLAVITGEFIKGGRPAIAVVNNGSDTLSVLIPREPVSETSSEVQKVNE